MKKRFHVMTVGALAATALLAANPAAAADEPVTPAKSAPAISVIGELNRLATYNTTALITFMVKADGMPLARRIVRVCSAPVGGDWTCVNAMTSSIGKVLALRPKVVAPVQVQLVVPESTTTEAATSVTVTVKPQVTVKVARKKTTMTVSLNIAANQYLLVKRQEGTRWVADGYPKPVTARTTTVTGLEARKRYQVVISDTATLRGATSKVV